MIKYSCSSNYLIYSNAIPIAIFLIATGTVIFKSTEDKTLQILIILIILSSLALLTIYTVKRIVKILYKETYVLVKYKFLPIEYKIDYSNIVEINYSHPHRGPKSNKLIFKEGNFKKKISYSSMKTKEYIGFLKWLKSKNEDIKFTVFPSNNYMNHLIQDEFGYNYRKYIKKTL